jgi:hypothetical protein
LWSPTGITLASSKQHTAHHIHQGVSLPGNLNGEVLLANLSQSIIPYANVFNLCRIVGSELLEQISTSALDGQQQQADEVQQREGRVDPGIGTGAADFLHTEGRVGCGKSRGEDEQGFVGTADVAGEEIWEDCAGRIDGGGVWFIVGVPLVLELCEGLCGFGGSQNEMFLGIVGLMV